MNSRLIIVGIAAALTVGLSGCGQSASNESAATTSSQSSQATVAAVTPRLVSANNFRDLAGSDGGYTTSDGRRVREGVLYRSNALITNDADAATLDALGLKAVYDLRTEAEIAKGPDRVPAGANYTNVNIIGVTPSASVASSVDLSTPEGAGALLTGMNRQFVTDPAMRVQFGKLLTEIAATDGPQLFHCTAGKDRAGWTSAMLLKIAGVDDATVMSNYLLTNEYSKDSIAATAAQVTAAKGEQAGAAMKVIAGVSPEFLQAGLDEISTNFGTFDNYLTSGLGLSTDTISTLKTKLTV